MIKGRFVNPTDLYAQAHTVAWAAVAGSPRMPYSLDDITDDDTLWEAIFSTAFLSIIPLRATLDGCAQALKSRSVTAAQVTEVHTPVPAATSVTDADMATARRWLSDTLHQDLDGDQQQLMIADHVLKHGWETHPLRLSSLMLAIVETADAARSQP